MTRSSEPDPSYASSAGVVLAGTPGGAMGAVDEIRRNPLRTLWRRRWIVVACMIVGMTIGFVMYTLKPPIYEGRSRILVSQSGPKMLQQDFPGSLSSGALWLNTQCEIIRSPAILGSVAGNPLVTGLKSIRDNPELRANVSGNLAARTFAAPGQRNEIITVAVRWTNPEDAATLANQIVAEYQRFNDSLKRTTASEAARLYTEAKAKNDTDLQDAYRRRKQFQMDNAALSFNRDMRNPVLERVNALSARLTQAEMDVVRYQAEYDTVTRLMDDPEKIRQLLANPQYRFGESFSTRRELREMQQAMAALSQTYLPGSSRLTGALERMERTKEELETEERNAATAILASIQSRLDAARQEAAQYKKWLLEEQAQVLMVNTRQAEFEIIEAEIRRMEKYSDQLADQLKTIDLAESAGAMNVFVVEQAKPNLVPVEPDRLRLMFYGAVAGTLAGLALAMLREFTDTRMRSADDIKHVLGMPILGVVPHIQQGRTPALRGTVVAAEPMSDVAEAYRTVRTAVYFGAGTGAVKTLLITSPAPGDGKTTLASNLAIAMAQAGNRVILLDCDFRKPNQHRIFELDKKIGLSSVLAGEATLEAATHKIARTPGLSVVPCGPIPANPSEILNSQGFADLLAKLSSSFDQVIVDSPPVLPVTDARILAASCDGVILAVRAEKTTRPAATQAREHLLSVGGRVLGVVVNDVPRRKGVYGYYYADEGRYAYYGQRRTRPNEVTGATNGSASNGSKAESEKANV